MKKRSKSDMEEARTHSPSTRNSDRDKGEGNPPDAHKASAKALSRVEGKDQRAPTGAGAAENNVNRHEARPDTNAESDNAPNVADQEKPFDFGGLPDRNLKRNLGCG